MRTITITYNGEQHTFPASARIARRAEEFSGMSTFKALSEQGDKKLPLGFVLGVVAAGLEWNNEPIEKGKEQARFEEIETTVQMDEVEDLIISVGTAFLPETPAAKAKNSGNGAKGKS